MKKLNKCCWMAKHYKKGWSIYKYPEYYGYGAPELYLKEPKEFLVEENP